LTGCEDDFTCLVCLVILREGFSYKEAQFKWFSLPVKTSCPSAQYLNETPAIPSKEKSEIQANEMWNYRDLCSMVNWLLLGHNF